MINSERKKCLRLSLLSWCLIIENLALRCLPPERKDCPGVRARATEI